MEDAKKKLIKQAEKLRKKRMFPFSMFNSPDYETSADKFKEAAGMSSKKEEKIRLLEESAKTYLLNPVEYNRYNCYIIYGELSDLYKNEPDKFIEYAKLSGDMALSCNRENLAANAYEKAVDVLVSQGNKAEAIELMRKICECYDNSCWKHHHLNSLKRLAFLEFSTGAYEEAAKDYLKLSKNIFVLCAGICYHLAGIVSDLDVTGEEEVVYKSLDKDPESIKIAIDMYMDNNAVDKEVRSVLNGCLELLKPENDIL
ncbi:hypothetical protein NBO_518g0002 [Nosema bombycis CQ1]|uniref:Uncharacterized protein n=1 Tax=Nosema bombycis (strain CQ1 / CVCC 102059) TaxID=578461 RepID=R0M271_NOSB1|nr:hypothetical protein NBO_518g0002 [Nosema bombycis CQ1]|eukprot:EOB12134.1 hypothetical protein NBO_518g0002 [Nosema bombycis CQ1]